MTILIPISSCKKKDSSGQVKQASFRINNVSKTFTSSTGFDRICSFSTYCNGFYQDENVTDKSMFYIGLPANARNGIIYTQADAGFSVYYLDENGNKYEIMTHSPFTLTVTTWEGNDGWTTGTFHGILYYINRTGGQDSVVVTEGSYQSSITYLTN
ncbi:MAG TPA: hypothetical protein VMC08_02170 [Bacteroidales bacterium]|nr:hypothetical protein [Bacteroidales bacterium]